MRTTEEFAQAVFTRSREAVTHMDAMAAAWERSDILAFDRERIAAMTALQDVREWAVTWRELSKGKSH